MNLVTVLLMHPFLLTKLRLGFNFGSQLGGRSELRMSRILIMIPIFRSLYLGVTMAQSKFEYTRKFETEDKLVGLQFLLLQCSKLGHYLRYFCFCCLLNGI